MDNPTIEFLLHLLFGVALVAPGATALVVVLVNVGKLFGVVKDGHAPAFVNILNVLFALVFGVLAKFFPAVNVPGLDTTVGSISATLTAFLPLLVIAVKWLAPKFYPALQGVPVLGYHFPKK